MKKYSMLLPGALLPYILLTVLALLYGGVLPTNILDIPAGFVMTALLLAYGFIAFILTVTFTALCLALGWDGKQVAKANMIIKLAQVPAYIAIFILGVFCFIAVITIMLSVFFVLFDCFSIFLSGLVGAAAAFRRFLEGKKDLPFWLVIGLLQFVFVADVFCCVILYAMNTTRNGQACQLTK